MRLFVILVTFFISQAHAKLGSFAPPNDVKIPERSKLGTLWATLNGTAGVSETEFNSVLDRAERYYSSVVASRGYQLHFNRLWQDPTANSDTDVEGNVFVINSYGGLARHPLMNGLGYAVVACHELGHHFGGAPLYPGQPWGGGGPANEGGSDYWAAKDCMKALGYSDAEISSGALSCASVLASLNGDRLPLPGSPSGVVVAKTMDEHPPAQCRLDTYLAGLNCGVRGDMSNRDPKINSCYYYPPGVADKGSRPRCWFKPVDMGTPPQGQPLPTPIATAIPVPTPRPQPTGTPMSCPVPPPQRVCKECRWICI